MPELQAEARKSEDGASNRPVGDRRDPLPAAEVPIRGGRLRVFAPLAQVELVVKSKFHQSGLDLFQLLLGNARGRCNGHL